MLASIGLIIACYTIFRYVERLLYCGHIKMNWAGVVSLTIVAFIGIVVTLVCAANLILGAPPPSY